MLSVNECAARVMCMCGLIGELGGCEMQFGMGFLQLGGGGAQFGMGFHGWGGSHMGDVHACGWHYVTHVCTLPHTENRGTNILL